MRNISPILFGLFLAVAGNLAAKAQDTSPTSSIPSVLQIQVETVKPYKGGALHDKSESAFVAAFARAKFPAYYVAMNSLSGKPRELFVSHYNSFAEWQKDNKFLADNHTLSAEYERAGAGDGELLESTDSLIFTYDADLSYHSHSDLSHHRFYQMFVFHVRPGHHAEWNEVVKMVKDAHDKMGDGAHWGMYDLVYGGAGNTYVAISGDPSMSIIDKAMADNKQYIEAMGGMDGMNKLDQLFGEAVDTSHTELFQVNPVQSYVPEDWIKEDPGFWKPKPSIAPAAKPAAAEKKP